MSRIKKSKTKPNNSSTTPVPSKHNSTSHSSGIYIPPSDKQKRLLNALVEMSESPVDGKKSTPQDTAKDTVNPYIRFIKGELAEFYYLTNAYIARGLDTESEAIIRHGWSVTPNNSKDQKALDLILNSNDFVTLIKTINTYQGLYGYPMMEMYSDEDLNTILFTLLPPSEMDYLRDNSDYILFDKNGEPQGYTQTKNGVIRYTWKGEEAKKIVVFPYRTIGGYILGIPGIQQLIWSAFEYGNIRGSISDSFARSLPVGHFIATEASEERLKKITEGLDNKFTARTTYVTDDTVEIKNIGVSNDIDVFKFIEPTLSEIAACFHMPIEMLGATQYLKGDDFLDRYGEWLEHIKMKQQTLANIFEKKVFGVIFPDGVKVKFNDPTTVNKTDLIKNVGFAKQSGAITEEQALEILLRNEVFGAFTSDMLNTTNKNKGDNSNGVQDQKQVQKEEVNSNNNSNGGNNDTTYAE